MAEAIFAGKQIEEFPFRERLSLFAPVLAEYPRLPEYLFVGNRPGDAGNGQRQEEKPEDLHGIRNR